MTRNQKCVYISAEIHTLIKHLSIELGTTMKELVEGFIREGVRTDAQYDPAVRQVLRYLPYPDLSPPRGGPVLPAGAGEEREEEGCADEEEGIPR